jgi:hypothetical protein
VQDSQVIQNFVGYWTYPQRCEVIRAHFEKIGVLKKLQDLHLANEKLNWDVLDDAHRKVFN